MDVFFQGVVWTPSKMIRRLGLEMKDESSIYHWAARNDIPVFSPALTDGSLVGFIFEDFFFLPNSCVLVSCFRETCCSSTRTATQGSCWTFWYAKDWFEIQKRVGNQHIFLENFRATSAS